MWQFCCNIHDLEGHIFVELERGWGEAYFFLLHSSANRREASVASAVKLGLAPVEAVGALVELFLKGPKLVVRGVATAVECSAPV